MGEDEGRAIGLFDDLGHRESFARPGDAEENLVLVSCIDAAGELFDGRGLIAAGLIVAAQLEIHRRGLLQVFRVQRKLSLYREWQIFVWWEIGGYLSREVLVRLQKAPASEGGRYKGKKEGRAPPLQGQGPDPVGAATVGPSWVDWVRGLRGFRDGWWLRRCSARRWCRRTSSRSRPWIAGRLRWLAGPG